MAVFDRYLGGGILGGLGLTAMMPDWPQLAANQVQFLTNATIGLGSFVISAVLSATVPATATFSVPSLGFSILPAAAGMIVTTVLIVFAGRSR
jgi:hypothetical protein